MGLILFIGYLLGTIVLLYNKKSIFSLSLIYLIIAPQIKLGTNDFDAMYGVIMYWLVLFLIQKKKININKKDIPYLLLIIFNFVLYFIMTLIYNSTIDSKAIAAIIGFCKLPILIILFNNLFPNDIRNIKQYDITFKIAILINGFGVLLQTIFGASIRSFFESMYLTEGYSTYSKLTDSLVYNRKFGFFGSPMLLGVFCAFCVLYFLDRFVKEGKKDKMFYLVLSLIIGITSLSKSFMIGVPIITFVYFVLYLTFKGNKIKIRKRFVKSLCIIILLLPAIIYIISKFYTYMIENTSAKYYFDLLNKPMQALETRYNTDSDSILLAKTYEIINQHRIFGVGFQSIEGEFLGDSTYVLAMHNGGVISLISIIIFYVFLLFKSLYRKKIEQSTFLILWIITGIGMSTMFNVIMILPFYLYFIHKESMENNLKERRNVFYERI